MLGRWKLGVLALVLCIVSSVSGAISAEEAGVHDWIRQHVGAPSQIFWKKNYLLVSSNSDQSAPEDPDLGLSTLSLLDRHNGEIVWRQKMPNDQKLLHSVAIEADNSIVAVTSTSQFYKFDLRGGLELVWTSKASIKFVDSIPFQETQLLLVLCDDDTLQMISPEGKLVHSEKLNIESKPIALRGSQSGKAITVMTKKGFQVFQVEEKNGQVSLSVRKNQTWKSPPSFLGNDHAVLTSGTQVVIINYLSDKEQSLIIEERELVQLVEKNSEDYSVLRLNSKKKTLNVQHASGVQTLMMEDFPETSEGLPERIFADGFSSPHFESIVVLFASKSMVFFSVSSPSTRAHHLVQEWVREEGLSLANHHLVVDLPSSHIFDSLAELDETEPNFLLQGYHRLHSQISQLQALFFHSKNSTLNSFQVEMVKDRFNTRKLLLVISSAGSLFAIQTESNQVVWKWHQPEFRSHSASLYLVRSSSHYPPEVLIHWNTKKQSILQWINPMDGKTSRPTQKQAVGRVMPLYRLVGESGDVPIVCIPDSLESVSVFPPEAFSAVSEHFSSIFFSVTDLESSALRGYALSNQEKSLKPNLVWQMVFGGESILDVTFSDPHEKISSPARLIGERSVQPKYLNPNLVAVATAVVKEPAASPTVQIYILDSVSGKLIYQASHSEASGPVRSVLFENFLVYSFWGSKTKSYQLHVIELTTEGLDWSGATNFSSFDSQPKVIGLTYGFHIERPLRTISFSNTLMGIAHKALLLGTHSGQILSNRNLLDSYKNEKLTQHLALTGIPFSAVDVLNYDKQIQGLHAISSWPTNLESTALVVGMGSDLFVTQFTPSGKFDLLSAGFDYSSLVLTMVAMTVGALVSVSYAREKQLNNLWA